MNNSILDFFIGLTMVNVLPHYLVGILKVRFLSLYGFGNKQNIAYAWTSIILSILLFHLNYGLGALLDHTWFIGGLFVILSYLALGNYLVMKFKSQR